MSRDYLVRATASEGQIRAFALDATNTVNEAQQRHSLFPVATAALGRTMSATLVLGAMQKGDEERLTVQIKGDGPLRGIVVTADKHGNVRGYTLNPQIHLPLNAKGKLSVGEAVGNGYLHVIRDLGLKEPYQGTVPLQTGEIGDDFAYYFAHSEQTPSVVGLGVLVSPDNSVKAAGGYVIQLMPGVDEEIVEKLEERIPHLPSVTSMLETGKSPEEILHLLLGDLGLTIREETPIGFNCDCSRDRFSQGLISLGKEELKSMVDEEDEIELICHFCTERYCFTKAELQELLRELEQE